MHHTKMTPERKQEIEGRRAAIDSDLADIAEGRVMPEVHDLANYEEFLLDMRESLEFELGEAIRAARQGKLINRPRHLAAIASKRHDAAQNTGEKSGP